jgi:hypothetical protein
MPKIYTHLTTQERAVVMIMRDDQCSIRSMVAIGTQIAPRPPHRSLRAHFSAQGSCLRS